MRVRKRVRRRSSVAWVLDFFIKSLMTGLKGWKDMPEKVFGAPFKAGSVSAEISPALLGVGYIIGPRIASIMCAGGVLAYLVLIPAIKFFGEGMTTVLPPGTVPISEMSPVRFAALTCFTSAQVQWRPAESSVCSAHCPQSGADSRAVSRILEAVKLRPPTAPRTDQDLSMKFVIGGIIALVGMIMVFPQLNLQWNLVRRDPDRGVWILVRHSLFTTHR